MIAILAVLFGVSSIVAIHELSHMLMAKLFGIKVRKFSLGFGPVLLSKTFYGTSYELALLPLGGYVQCSGETPGDNTKGDFFFEPWYKRALIALAGPVANLFLGFAIIYGVLVFGYNWPILAGFVRAFKVSALIITTTLQWLFGTLPPATQAAATQSTGLAGPIMITKILLTSLKEGASQFLFVLSLISLSLGLFNLFPLPSLDGGHVFLYILEGIRGRKFSNKVYIMWAYVGFILLGMLMLYLCASDISTLLK